MLLNVKNVRKQYQRDKVFVAVDNVSFSLAHQDFACIMGRSGSGKTTLLNMIAGIITPTQGRVIIDNTDISVLADKQVSQFRNQTIGYVPQGNSLLTSLNAIENICLPYIFYNKGNQNLTDKDNLLERAEQLMQQVGISYLSQLYPKQMSGGEMRRVAIVRSLICAPKLLLADEPTNDLDQESAEQIMQLLATINLEGTAILMVTHDLDVANYAKHQYKMEAGKLHLLN